MIQSSSASRFSNSPKNILYIFTDDQSLRTVSSYPEAYSWVHTPNLDRLAQEGVRFTTCYTGAWCAPSRATALTGRLQHAVHSMRLPYGYPNYIYDAEELQFWPSVFRREGWYTGIVGKWHTGSDHGHGRDWDYSAIWDYSQSNIYGKYYTNQKMSINGGEPTPVGGYSTDNYTRYALDFIHDRAADPDRPWYLWLCYDAPHGPWKVADRHIGDYSNVPQEPIPTDIYPPRPTKAAHMRTFGMWKPAQNGQPVGLDDGRTLTEWLQQYNQAIRAVDEGVGQILEALESTGQLDNTLIVFTSDQGFAWGEHGFRNKFAPYDANLLAPLIVRLPGMISAGTVCRTPVGGQDMAPTFFSMAGLPLPWKMHGQDLTPLFKNPEQSWDRPLLLVNTNRSFGRDTDQAMGESNSAIPWWISLRTGNYKYIRWLVPGEIEELYDLENDPEELFNLSLEAGQHGLLAQCRQEMIAELRRTDAGMVDNLPPVLQLTKDQLLGGQPI
jgi:arylsulfatase A-like enzyme